MIERLQAVLPQTQCTQCGYEGCSPYAEALADGTALTDRCPPGGDAGAAALAAVLARPPIAQDRSRGSQGPLALAVIDEAHCIGCTLCIRACPVDAIAGANKRMHTVLADACTGCELCIAPCPVDCIRMVPLEPKRYWTRDDARLARERHRQRQARLARVPASARSAAGAVAAPSAATPAADGPRLGDPEHKRAAIAAALARARARRSPQP
ncbi:electron transport complex subunit RsxB [Verticiella sediminum]